jgi:hypothetical protein
MQLLGAMAVLKTTASELERIRGCGASPGLSVCAMIVHLICGGTCIWIRKKKLVELFLLPGKVCETVVGGVELAEVVELCVCVCVCACMYMYMSMGKKIDVHGISS